MNKACAYTERMSATRVEVGDVIMTEQGDKARVTLKEKSKIFRGGGGCWKFNVVLIDGEHKGESITDQHFTGNHELFVVRGK